MKEQECLAKYFRNQSVCLYKSKSDSFQIGIVKADAMKEFALKIMGVLGEVENRKLEDKDSIRPHYGYYALPILTIHSAVFFAIGILVTSNQGQVDETPQRSGIHKHKIYL